MVLKKLKNEPTTITVNCAGTCKRTAIAGVSALALILGIPAILVAMYLFGGVLYNVLYWAASCHAVQWGDRCDIAAFGSFFGTVIVFGGAITVTIAVCVMDIE